MSETNTGGGTGDGGRLGRIPEQVAQQAAGIGRAVGDAVGPKAEDIANRSTAAGADAVAGVARTAEALADTVAPDSPAIAEEPLPTTLAASGDLQLVRGKLAQARRSRTSGPLEQAEARTDLWVSILDQRREAVAGAHPPGRGRAEIAIAVL